jgi:hypothetical protein
VWSRVSMSLLFCGCAASVSRWNAADDACDTRRDAFACHETTSAIEAPLNLAWPVAAGALPNWGDAVVAVKLDGEGKIEALDVVESRADESVMSEAMEQLRRHAPYPGAAGTRLFVRFVPQPPHVRVVLPPKGNVAKVQSALKEKRRSLFSCYAAGATWSKLPLEGTLVVKVGVDGKVIDARFEAKSEPEEALLACLLKEARTVEVAAWQHEGQVARLPIYFSVIKH